MSMLLKGDRRRKDPCSGVLLPILQSSRAWFRTPLRRQNQTKYHGTCRRVVVEGWEHCVLLDRAMSLTSAVDMGSRGLRAQALRGLFRDEATVNSIWSGPALSQFLSFGPL